MGGYWYSLVIVSLCAITVFYLLAILRFNGPFFDYGFGTRGLLSFNVGVILCILYQKKERLILAVPITAIPIYAISIVIGKQFGYGPSKSLIPFATIIWPAVICMVLLIKPIAKIFRSRIMRYVSSLSMDIYMFHFPIQIMIAIAFTLFTGPIPYEQWWFLLIYITLVISFCMLLNYLRSKFRKTTVENNV